MAIQTGLPTLPTPETVLEAFSPPPNSETEPRKLSPQEYLQALDGIPALGIMNRHDQERDILLTPRNIGLFVVHNAATTEASIKKLIEYEPELSHKHTHLIVDRLEDIKDSQEQNPDRVKKEVGIFYDERYVF